MKVMTFLEVLFLSVALSGMFPQEAQHRTDQLILSSRRGRTALYTGKLLAGLTVGVGFGLLLLATLLGVTGLVYGLEGFGVSALFTLLMPLGASIGQVTLILFGAFLAAAAVTSLAAMVLSQVTRNSVATMGILVGSPADHAHHRGARKPQAALRAVVSSAQQFCLTAGGVSL